MRHPPPDFEAVLFDLDGTLIDTEPSAARAVKEIFETWGISLDVADAAFVTGRTWDAALSWLFSKYPPPLPRQDATRLILDRYRSTLQSELVVVPGSIQAVKSLARRYPLALVSGSHRSEIQWTLQKLGILKHFKTVLGAEDYPQSKPAPDGFLKACDLLGVQPSKCLIFEDSDAGIASARATGAFVIAVTGTNHFGQNTGAAHTEVIDLQAVNEQWVRQFAGRLR